MCFEAKGFNHYSIVTFINLFLCFLKKSRIFLLDSPVSDFVWNFKTQGMTAVGQDEIVILLVKKSDEDLPPRDIFEHLQSLYEQSGNGAHVLDMGYSVILSGSRFLDSTDFGGFLFFRHTFQCLDGLDVPKDPFLFGVLITRWEMPWARVFPLRLLLRLGAESRYYPTPLWSWRERSTVYKEIGQTIMQVLCVSHFFLRFTYSSSSFPILYRTFETSLIPYQSSEAC